jgi:hypothetical protein
MVTCGRGKIWPVLDHQLPASRERFGWSLGYMVMDHSVHILMLIHRYLKFHVDGSFHSARVVEDF